jgi:hypothetical protein
LNEPLKNTDDLLEVSHKGLHLTRQTLLTHNLVPLQRRRQLSPAELHFIFAVGF